MATLLGSVSNGQGKLFVPEGKINRKFKKKELMLICSLNFIPSFNHLFSNNRCKRVGNLRIQGKAVPFYQQYIVHRKVYHTLWNSNIIHENRTGFVLNKYE